MGNTVTLQNFRKFQDLANNVKIIRSSLKFLLNTLIVMSFPLFPKIIFFYFFVYYFWTLQQEGAVQPSCCRPQSKWSIHQPLINPWISQWYGYKSTCSWPFLKLHYTCINKRPMGHIAHLRNQFKSINMFQQSYGYIITLIRSGRTIISFLRIECSMFIKPWVPFNQVKFSWNWSSGSGEEDF